MQRFSLLFLITAQLLMLFAPKLNGEEEKLRPIEITIEVKAPAAKAWQLWTTKEGLQKFFAKQALIELKPGGSLEVWFAPDAPSGQRGAEGLKVLAYIPEQVLVFEWNAPPKYPKARAKTTFIVIRFESMTNEMTRLRFTQGGFAERSADAPDEKEEWIKTRQYLAQAWPQVLANFKKVVEK